MKTSPVHQNLRHVMVDLETLGTGPNACIVSIGAVRFDPNQNVVSTAGPDTFYRVVNLVRTPRTELGDMDASTVLWWMRQEDDARAQLQLACESKDYENVLCNVLEAFESWLESCGCTEKTKSEWRFWANDPDFDMVVLKSAFVRVFGEDNQLPWSFRGCRSMRTMRELATEFHLKAPEDHIVRGVQHHALDDAIYQAQVVTLIKQELRKKMGQVERQIGVDMAQPGEDRTVIVPRDAFEKRSKAETPSGFFKGGMFIDPGGVSREEIEKAAGKILDLPKCGLEMPSIERARRESEAYRRRVLGKFPQDDIERVLIEEGERAAEAISQMKEPQIKKDELAVGDYVKVAGAHGSYGKIQSISFLGGVPSQVYVKFIYGRDKRGEQVTAMSGISPRNLERISRDEYEQVERSEFNTGFKPVKKALDIQIEINKKPESIKVGDYVRHKADAMRVGIVSEIRTAFAAPECDGIVVKLPNGAELHTYFDRLVKITELDYLAAVANAEVSRAVRIIRAKGVIDAERIFDMAEEQQAATGVRPTVIVFGDGSALNIPDTRNEFLTVAREPFDGDPFATR